MLGQIERHRILYFIIISVSLHMLRVTELDGAGQTSGIHSGEHFIENKKNNINRLDSVFFLLSK